MLKPLSVLLLIITASSPLAASASTSADTLAAEKCRVAPSAPAHAPSVDLGVSMPADLRIVKSHAGSFSAGQIGASYTIMVDNVGATTSSGLVTVVDNLPAGLTATYIGGCVWDCTLTPLSCTTTDPLDGGMTYPPIILEVDVSASAPASVVNTATLSGGVDSDASNNLSADTTIILGGVPIPVSLPVDARLALMLLGLLLLYCARRRLKGY